MAGAGKPNGLRSNQTIYTMATKRKGRKYVKRTVWFVSKTQPGIKYKTERHRNGHVSCFCPGFVYTLHCRHAERAQQWA